MAEIRVDTSALRSASTELTDVSERLGSLGSGHTISRLVDCLPSSCTSSVVPHLSAHILSALRAASIDVSATATALSASAESYHAADRLSAQPSGAQLRSGRVAAAL
jgi:hypothetical protein